MDQTSLRRGRCSDQDGGHVLSGSDQRGRKLERRLKETNGVSMKVSNESQQPASDSESHKKIKLHVEETTGPIVNRVVVVSYTRPGHIQG